MSLLSELWWCGVRAAGGKPSVARALSQGGAFAATEVLAVGKAAASMCRGALECLPAGTPALVVTKRGHAGSIAQDFPKIELIEAGHPIPDVQSLLAGQRLYERIRQAPADSRLLVLISGGASALAERLPPGVSLLDWQRKTGELVGSGANIHEINVERSKLSLIKAGRVLKAFAGDSVCVLAISDVEGNSLGVIGSGLADPRYLTCGVRSEIVAANATARAAIVSAAWKQGITVRENSETLYGNLPGVAQRMAEALRDGEPGLYLWGGEPTIELPEQPGKGGRNQSLALAVARELSVMNAGAAQTDALDVEVLVAGTDGTDGPTSAAGGSLRHAGQQDPLELNRYLTAADAGSLLAARDELFVTGPTDTNVMDLALCLKR